MVAGFDHGHERRSGFRQDVDEAMQSFIRSMAGKDTNGILSGFSQKMPWKYQPYEIGTGRPLPAEVVNPKQMANDFQKKLGCMIFSSPIPMATPSG